MQILILLLFLVLATLSSIAQVFPGADVLLNNPDKYLSGKKVYLLTNHAGRTADGLLTADKLIEHPAINLVGVMVPEHGFFTSVRAGVAVKSDSFRGIPVISLYGKERKPSQKTLSNCDVVVVDLQDIGVRSYTYISTLIETMEACAEAGKEIIILDRPNPLGGLIVDGNTPDDGVQSFVCRVPVPYLHGLTIGELAKMAIGEGWVKPSTLDLKVVKMANWERWMQFEDTGLTWFPTSPHVPTVNSIRGLAATGVFGELGALSIGIGTTLPFQYIGHPVLSSMLTGNYVSIDGVSFFENRYQPFYGMYSGTDVPGYVLQFSNDNQARYYTAGMKFFRSLRKAYPKLFANFDVSSRGGQMFTKTTGSPDILPMFVSGDFDSLDKKLEQGIIDFLTKREEYLLYK